MITLPQPCVYAVSDRRRLAPAARTLAEELRAVESWAAELVDAGVDAIQIRERDLPARDLRDLAGRIVARAAGGSTLIVVNDRADVARAAGAAGVHLPSQGLPSRAVRAWWADALIGRSVHAGDERDAADGCDYVIYGTVFPSRSKPGSDHEAVGALEQAVSLFPCAVIAIGGVTPDRIPAMVAAGAMGAAAIGAFLPIGLEPEARGPTQAVEAFRRAFRREMVQ